MADMNDETAKKVVAEIASPPTLREQFDELTRQKVELWDAIKDNELFKLTAEWEQIETLDAELWRIHAQMEVSE